MSDKYDCCKNCKHRETIQVCPLWAEICKTCVPLKSGEPPSEYRPSEYRMKTMPKPSLGLTPRWLNDEQRVGEILIALINYNNAGKPVPQEWLEELNEKIKKETK